MKMKEEIEKKNQLTLTKDWRCCNWVNSVRFHAIRHILLFLEIFYSLLSRQQQKCSQRKELSLRTKAHFRQLNGFRKLECPYTHNTQYYIIQFWNCDSQILLLQFVRFFFFYITLRFHFLCHTHWPNVQRCVGTVCINLIFASEFLYLSPLLFSLSLVRLLAHSQSNMLASVDFSNFRCLPERRMVRWDWWLCVWSAIFFFSTL